MRSASRLQPDRLAAVEIRDDDGRLVITMGVEGDLRGALTLIVTDMASDGTVRAGEWAIVNTYIEDVASTSTGGSAQEGHSTGEVLVHKGTVNGTLAGGTLAFGVALAAQQTPQGGAGIYTAEDPEGHRWMFGQRL